jgi:hypothetical protein
VVAGGGSGGARLRGAEELVELCTAVIPEVEIRGSGSGGFGGGGLGLIWAQQPAQAAVPRLPVIAGACSGGVGRLADPLWCLFSSSVWWNGRAAVGRVGCFLSVVELVDHGQDHLLPYFRPVAWGLLAWIK